MATRWLRPPWWHSTASGRSRGTSARRAGTSPMGMARSSKPSARTLAVWRSQSSRTSSTSGAPSWDFSQSFNAAGRTWSIIGVLLSEMETGGLGEVREARRHGVPGLLGLPRGFAGSADEGGAHHRLAADHGAEAAADLQLREQGVRHFGDGTGKHDHVEGAFGGQALGAVGFTYFDIAHAGALQVVAGHLHQLGDDLQD